MKPGVPIDGAARTAEIPLEASEIPLEASEIPLEASEIPFEASDIQFEASVISIETAEIPTAAATPASGILALAAAAAPTRPSAWTRKGIPERIDPEYKRHGTSGIIASRNAAAGEILLPLIQPTKTEADFARHIRGVIMMNPEDKYIIISDNLNTHKSETLVKLIAEDEKIDSKLLGAEEKYGILKSMASRAEFLGDGSHRVVFKYTPRHCSWLNQIECWFSILGRQLLNRRASFASVGDLEGKIRAFVDFYNSNMKKPFKWNFTGNILRYSL
jgi:hypothetical protein